MNYIESLLGHELSDTVRSLLFFAKTFATEESKETFRGYVLSTPDWVNKMEYNTNPEDWFDFDFETPYFTVLCGDKYYNGDDGFADVTDGAVQDLSAAIDTYFLGSQWGSPILSNTTKDGVCDDE